MRECRTLGSAGGAARKGGPYRNPIRRVEGDIQLSPGVHVAPGDLLDPPQASPHRLEAAPTALPPGWWPAEDDVVLSNPGGVTVTRYLYRANRIPTPWAVVTQGSAT